MIMQTADSVETAYVGLSAVVAAGNKEHRSPCPAAAAVVQGALMVNDEELLQGFLRCRQLGALPMVCSSQLFSCSSST
jgi:hypothetical protein